MYLVVAGLFECGWAIGLKYTEGFSRLVPSVLTIIAMAASFWLLSVAMKTIPVGTAYAVWTGIGAVGVAILGMLFLGESRELLRDFLPATNCFRYRRTETGIPGLIGKDC